MSEIQIISRAQAKACGLSHYFTGRPCSRGHVCKRRVTSMQCLGCAQVYNRRARDLFRQLKGTESGKQVAHTRREACAGGLTRYWPDRPCLRGHYAARVSANGECVECNKIRAEAVRRNAGARIRPPVMDSEEKKKAKSESSKRWKENNRESVKKIHSAYNVKATQQSKKARLALRILNEAAKQNPNIMKVIGDINDVVG